MRRSVGKKNKGETPTIALANPRAAIPCEGTAKERRRPTKKARTRAKTSDIKDDVERGAEIAPERSLVSADIEDGKTKGSIDPSEAIFTASFQARLLAAASPYWMETFVKKHGTKRLDNSRWYLVGGTELYPERPLTTSRFTDAQLRRSGCGPIHAWIQTGSPLRGATGRSLESAPKEEHEQIILEHSDAIAKNFQVLWETGACTHTFLNAVDPISGLTPLMRAAMPEATKYMYI